jgi:transposase-like protein
MPEEGRTLTLDSRALAASAGAFLPEDVARTLLEQLRWPNGPVCPHCRSTEAYRLHPKADSARPVRDGVLKCKACRRQFTVTVGTAFARSHLGLNKWLLAIAHLCRSDNDTSGRTLDRLLGVSPQTARFLGSRLRRVLTGSRSPASGAAPSRSLLASRASLAHRGKAFLSTGSAMSRPSGKTSKPPKPLSRSATATSFPLGRMSFVEALATMMTPGIAQVRRQGDTDPGLGQPAVPPRRRSRSRAIQA